MKNENKVMNNRVLYGVCIISFWFSWATSIAISLDGPARIPMSPEHRSRYPTELSWPQISMGPRVSLEPTVKTVLSGVVIRDGMIFFHLMGLALVRHRLPCRASNP